MARASKLLGAFGRILAKRWFPFVAGGIAVCLVATAIVVGVTRIGPDDASAPAAQAPSAFPSSLSLSSLPVITRGQTAHLSLRATDTTSISVAQVFDNGQLYLTVTKPQTVRAAGSVRLALPVDFGALHAGIHVLSARIVDSRGKVALPPPVQLPVLDQTAASDPTTTVTVTTSAGETTTSLARRLGTTPTKLSFPIVNGVNPFAGKTPGLISALPVGISVDAPLPSVSAVTTYTGYHVKNPDTPAIGLSTSTKGCRVTVTAHGTDSQLALYASTPLQSGFVRVGDVSVGHPFVSAALPIGPNSFIAYDAVGGNAPSDPASATVPDSCASSGWTGSARILNGVLITDSPLVSPYAYVSIDRGNWQRVPGDQGRSLADGTLNDLRSYLTLGVYDQLDVQVWTIEGATALLGASGEFCRAREKNADATHSSKSSTGCRPPGTSPAAPSAATPSSISLRFVNQSSYGGTASGVQAQSDPNIYDWLNVSSDTPVTVAVHASAASQVQLQYGYFPISTASTAINPPGVFFTQELQLTNGSATYTFDPWKWQNAKISTTTSTDFSTSGNNLALPDQEALSQAKANLDAHHDLLSTFYVRAVADPGYYNQSPPTPAASKNLEINLTDPTSYPTLTAPIALLIPGVDEHATDQATRGECFELTSYPPQNTWLARPWAGPSVVFSANGTTLGTTPGDITNSDYDLAVASWPSLDTTYCLDPNADALRKAAADAQADAQANECGAWCVIEAGVVGAVVGFAVGGPYGALVGAAAAIGLALVDGPAIAGLEGDLSQLWDAVAQEYNTIYGSLLELAGELNPVCFALSQASQKDGNACSAITADLAAAAMTYMFGLPRTLPTSAQLAVIAKGDFEGIVEDGIDALASVAGVDCSDLTIPASEGKVLSAAADKAGASGAQAALDSSRNADGDYSLCHGLAELATNAVSAQFTAFTSQLFSSSFEAWLPPGMGVQPVQDSAPNLLVSATAAQPVASGAVCPATVNMTVALAGQSAYDPGTKNTVQGPATTWKLAPQKISLTTADGIHWSGIWSVPLLPRLFSYDPTQVLDTRPTAVSDPYLTLDVDSPCFAQSTASIVARQYGTTLNQFAFVNDNRPVTYYH